jgi:hypothetical protein
MESIVDIVFNAENIRMLVLLAFGFCGYMTLKTSLEKRIGGVEVSLGKRIDGVETSLGKRIDGLDHKIDGVETSLGKRIDALDHKIDGVETSLNHKIDHKIDCLEFSLLKAMDEKIAAANQSLYAQLKANDFKHLNDTIEALTFILEKNKFLAIEDKEYIDGRLDK